MSTPPPPERRMQLRGIHHVTLICRDIERTTAFYRDVLGMALVHQGTNDDDPGARHFHFGDAHGTPGTLVSFLEYPALPAGVAGIGSTHHIAFMVETEDELEAWRDYLRSRGIGATEAFDRGNTHSLYLRDPDGHVLELATRGPGF